MSKLFLIKKAVEGSICGTTTKDGSRSRYSSGIFLPQIPFKGYAPIPHTLIYRICGKGDTWK
ncbi:hypothetical protein [Rodentibacter sp. Ppn85]|uniref:hypothetical protein n=1 Tax=Rodentibacter sp. Ppn85 TaxID=1908525 RepID=UPI001E3C2C3E|nr:hypothetical protein [Rodentibacter sp. Ppn85]